jgi:spore cortex formation protein SpoVR/YcgB (stage V sporulation)
MFQDIKRICQSPTEEDKYWFPDIAGSDWLETLHFAMRDFKDEFYQPVPVTEGNARFPPVHRAG